MGQILVDADQLEDLCTFVEGFLGRATEDRVLDVAVIRGVPLSEMAAARGALAEIRCRSTVVG